MATLKLPESPTGVEFEELVAAILQSSGHYIDRRIVLRESEEILEIDIMAQPFGVAYESPLLIEAKSGKYGYTDVFKVAGWMHYLKLKRGALVVGNQTDKVRGLSDVGNALAIKILHLNPLRPPKSDLKEVWGPRNPDRHTIKFWRYTYWLERRMNRFLDVWAKSTPDVLRYHSMKQYREGITSGTFFESEPLRKVRRLYGHYRRFPQLTKRVGAEMDGGRFDGTNPQISRELFGQTFYRFEYNPLQTSSHLEHQGRLGILKAAAEYALLNHEKDDLDFGDEGHSTLLDDDAYPAIPASFVDGFHKIRNDRFFRRYPVLWQWMLGPLGGFILTDHQEREMQWLSEVSGIPHDQVPRALEAFDLLFPIDGGWWTQNPHSNMKVLKQYPAPLRGLGCIERVFRLAEERDFKALVVQGTYTKSDLKRYAGKCVELLTRDP